MASIFVTGGTGFLGRQVVERLAQRGHRLGLLVRPATASRQRAWLDAVTATATARGGSLTLHHGDVLEHHLGGVALDAYTHVIHAAAIYDLEANEDLQTTVNVEGTVNVLAAIRHAGGRAVLTHISSVAVAGDHKGVFREDDLDLSQSHPTPYHRSKFDAERRVREATDLAVRIVRPSAIVGDSKTGVADRHDGPYVLFSAIKTLRYALPGWFPLVGFTKGHLDLVPVDFVADAIVHLALAPGLDGQTFHVVDPAPPTFRDAFNTLSHAAGGPQITRSLGGAPKLIPGLGDMIGGLGAVAGLKGAAMEQLGVPAVFERARNFDVRFDTTRADATLSAAGLRCPPLASYAPALWDHWSRHLDPERTPDLRRTRGVLGKRVLITGASSGVGEALARLVARHGGEVVLVARRQDELERVASEIRADGGVAHVVACDLSDLDAADALVTHVLDTLGPIDILVNNAARSIRRTIPETYDRPNDYERTMRLNYLAPVHLCLGFLPSMVERQSGHIVSVLTAGTHMPTPRFAAYVSSKAALSAFTDTLAAEYLHENVHATSVFLGWVKTPMMTATEKYKARAESDDGVTTPEAAAAWILDGIVAKKRHVKTATTTRRFALTQISPLAMTRALSYVYRIYHDQPERFPELTVDRALFKRFFKHDLV
jgi:short-subunit dehydrogenase